MEPTQRGDQDAVDPVEALVATALERLSEGQAGALEELCERHPEHARELRERFDSLREMNLLPSDRAAMAFPERLGEFRLLRRLGSGGMGVVYEAVQEPLGRHVALKLIRPEHLYFERSRERFQRETEAVARLSHPGVVAIHTVGEAGGTPYFAMEMIRGATVAQALEQVRALAPEGLLGTDLRAAVQACAEPDASAAREPREELWGGGWVDACARVILHMTEALQHAHERGVLHRDIKPSNIALTLEGRVVLLDFGLAGLDDELRMTRSGSALGSVLYMAPEQVAGRHQEIDARTDVYALGVTLYEMLTLQPPFAAPDAERTRAAILEGHPPPIRPRNRSVSRDLEIVCLHAIDRERSRRYATMEEFGADLRNVLEGRPIRVRPPSAAYRTWRWVARHPTLSTALILGGLLLTIVPSALYLQQRTNNAALQALLAEVSQAKERESQESARARQAAREAELAASFLVGLFGASDPYETGRRDLTAREMLDAGLVRVDDELGDEPELRARLLERIGLSYNNLDLYAQAIPPLERALELRRELHGDEDARTASAKLLLGSARRLAGLADSTELLRAAHETFLRHPPENPMEIVNAEALLALGLIDEGQSEEPLALLSSAHRRMEQLGVQDPAMRWMVGAVLATTHQRLAQFPEAEAVARDVLEREGEVPPSLQPWRCATLHTLASALDEQGEHAEARAKYEQALAESEPIYAPGNPTRALMESDFAEFLFREGERARALGMIDAATRTLREQLGFVHPKARSVLFSYADLAVLALEPERVLALLEEAYDELARGGAGEPALSTCRFRLGATCLALGDAEDAVAWLSRCDPEQLEGGVESRATVELSLARAQLAAGFDVRAAEALALGSHGNPRPELDAIAQVLSARVAWELGEVARAEQRAQAALAVLPDTAAESWVAHEARVVLAAQAQVLAPTRERCTELAASLRAIAAELGPHHADLAALRRQLERAGVTAACTALGAGAGLER